MSRRFVNDFNEAIKGTAPGSTGIAILNVLTAVGCVVAAPFTFGTSLFGLLAIPVYSSLSSIANETYRTRRLLQMDLEIKADKEGLFEIRPPRPVRRKLSDEAYEQESFENDDWDTDPEEEIFDDIENQVSNENDSADQILTEEKEKKEGKPEDD
ncbi:MULTISPECIES: hypothetical protein [unclassified Prochlorococcus]|uniref:hypothetical protein n=1 Tax=unclassified Prochlorococcus TaxID=2627481 RepID=UPI00056501D6|nr:MULTISPECIES: hypothetical protein [unclassified Prochlorococcus]